MSEKKLYVEKITKEDVDRSSTLEAGDIGKHAIYSNGAIVGMYNTQLDAVLAANEAQGPLPPAQDKGGNTEWARQDYELKAARSVIKSCETLGLEHKFFLVLDSSVSDNNLRISTLSSSGLSEPALTYGVDEPDTEELLKLTDDQIYIQLPATPRNVELLKQAAETLDQIVQQDKQWEIRKENRQKAKKNGLTL